MRLQISDMLRVKLLNLREAQLQNLRGNAAFAFCYEQQCNVEGVHLHGSIGYDLYLTLDGRVLFCKDDDSAPHETLNLACISLGLVCCADACELPELLEFLPPRPSDEPVCRYCEGTRFLDYPNGTPRRQVCGRCWGLGWGQPTMNPLERQPSENVSP
jgi:hypothetical protein